MVPPPPNAATPSQYTGARSTELRNEGNTYYIDSAEDLALFLTNVRTNGISYEGKTVILTTDISWLYPSDGSKDDWKTAAPAAASVRAWINTLNNPFKGTFDGQGHSISNVYISLVDAANPGGFLGTVENGTVKNLSILNAYVSGFVVGGIAGVCKGATIENCYVDAYITGPNNGKAKVHGGIAGLGSAVIKNCIFNGTIFTPIGGHGYSGGIVGFLSNRGSGNFSTILSGYYTNGKSIGTLETCVLENCVNLADNPSVRRAGSDGDYYSIFGGVFGQIFSAAEVTGCVNFGTISNTRDPGDTTSNTNGYGAIGGRIASDQNVNVSNCYWLEGSNPGADHAFGISSSKGTVTVPTASPESAFQGTAGRDLFADLGMNLKNWWSFTDEQLPAYNDRKLVSRGWQDRKDSNDVRIVAAVEGLEIFDQVGFKLSAVCAGENFDFDEQLGNKVWGTIKAGGDTERAPEGYYLFGAMIKNLPATDPVTFSVWMIGEKDGVKTYVYAGAFTYEPAAIIALAATFGATDTPSATGDDCDQAIFKNKTIADFHTALTVLAGIGFEEYDSNDLEGNLFATYIREDSIVTVWFLPTEEELRVIEEPRAGHALAPLTASSSGTCETLLTQLGSDFKNASEQIGMCYVYHLDDGSFIVIDGNLGSGEEENLYNLLKKQAPDPGHIVIAAWILTHAHTDHTEVFKNFAEKYNTGNKYQDVTVERFIYHFPSADQPASAELQGRESALVKRMKYFPGAERNIAHAGQRYRIRNAEITILATVDVLGDTPMTNYNVSSLVFRVQTGDHTFLVTGDHNLDGSKTQSDELFMNMYSAATLQSEFVQVIHHGNGGGGTEAFYQTVSPTYVLWPVGLDYHNSKLQKYASQNTWLVNNYAEGTTRFLSDKGVTVFNLSGATVTFETNSTIAGYLGT